MRTKTLIIIALAFVAGGTCPSDVNNDGVVGVNDFLQVLADWGPCPNASVVSMAILSGGQTTPKTNDADGALIRLWSDNTLEVGVHVGTGNGDWTCDEAFPRAGEWENIEAPPTTARPISVDQGFLFFTPTFFVTYADGSVWTRRWEIHIVDGCSTPGFSAHFEFKWASEWTPFEGVPR